MLLHTFPSNGLTVNLDQITTVKSGDNAESTIIRLADGCLITVPTTEYKDAIRNIPSINTDPLTNGMARKLMEAMNRLSISFPHSVRAHF